MRAENKMPAIRFRGFSGEWQGRELGEITSKIGSGKTPKGGSSTYVSEGIPLLRSQNIYNNLVNLNDVAYITVHTHDEMENSRVINHDVLLNITGASIGRSSVYSLLNEANVNQHVCIIRLIDGYSSIFTQLLLASYQGQQQIDNNQAGGAREGLNFQHIGRMSFVFSSIEEQTKIGNYFQQLDTLIAQHQKKHDKLLNLKKALLEKLFPKQGASKPEIRFKGFSGEWEEKVLGAYAKFRRGSFPQPYGKKEWYGGEDAMPFVQVVDVTKTLALVKDTKQKISAIAQPKSVFVEKGKVLVTLQGSIGRVAIAQYDAYVDRTLLIFETFNKKTDSRYWAYLIQNKFDTEKRKAPGGTIKTITKEVLSGFLVDIPNYNEQTKIGNLFKQLDTLITQHQAQLKKLNNIKQACLEKMFV